MLAELCLQMLAVRVLDVEKHGYKNRRKNTIITFLIEILQKEMTVTGNISFVASPKNHSFSNCRSLSFDPETDYLTNDKVKKLS
jgi:hypothetical protein